MTTQEAFQELQERVDDLKQEVKKVAVRVIWNIMLWLQREMQK